MKKYILPILIIGIIFVAWLILGMTYSNIDISTKYSKGKVTTNVTLKGIENVTSTEFRYRTYFLEQYMNLEPQVDTYSFSKYKQNHNYEIRNDLFQGKKDLLEVEVIISYEDGTQQITKKVVMEDIKEKIYNDFVIKPKIKDDKVYYYVDGLTAVIDKKFFNEDIIFYTNSNEKYPNIIVGFQKDYTLYPLKSFGILSKAEASEKNYEGVTQVDFIIEQGANEDFIVVEYGMYDLVWDGLYPYDLDGNKVFYEGEEGDTEVNLIVDNQQSKVSKVSHEKYKQMLNKIPKITFIISNE